eukprot:3366253-Heterocapsa_arctica.AAC.1
MRRAAWMREWSSFVSWRAMVVERERMASTKLSAQLSGSDTSCRREVTPELFCTAVTTSFRRRKSPRLSRLSNTPAAIRMASAGGPR